jgi:hypothetical protein
MNVFDEARRSREGFVEVDFLTGTSTGALTSPSLTHAIDLYGRALASQCEKYGTTPAAFKRLTARYHGGSGARFSVTVENHEGWISTDEYVGIPGRRPRTLDWLGRIRPKQGHVRRPAVDGKIR